MRNTINHIGLLLLLLLISCGQKEHKLTILFDRIDNLQIGSGVYCKGLQVGEVLKEEFYRTGEIIVDVKLGSEIKIPVDSRFIIKNNSLTGTIIEIHFSDSTNYITPTDTLTGYYKGTIIPEIAVTDTAAYRRALDTTLKQAIKEISTLFKKDSAK